jgi:hypothetical protein
MNKWSLRYFLPRMLFLSLLITLSQAAWSQRLSDSVRASLLTIAPATELYNQFGHTALRIHDPVTGFDYCYNYGVYDFDTPNFYQKFVTGHLNYMMSVVPTERELPPYRRIGRGVIEQDFNLKTAEVKRLAELLRENYRPENRYYLYDFFYDNCATRIRDMVEEALDTYFTPPPYYYSTKTFRDLLEEKIHMTPWSDFGIDFILGRPTDIYAGFRGEMFLPEYLAANMSMVEYQGQPLLGPPRVLVPNRIEIGSDPWLPPARLFWGLLVLFSLTWLQKSGQIGRLLDSGLFFALAFGGLFLLFMRYGTEHFSTWKNYNLLWANPLYLIPLIHLWKPRAWMRPFYWILLALAVSNLIGFLFPPQGFHRALIPLLLLIGSRLVYRIYLSRRPTAVQKDQKSISLSEEE